MIIILNNNIIHNEFLNYNNSSKEKDNYEFHGSDHHSLKVNLNCYIPATLRFGNLLIDL